MQPRTRRSPVIVGDHYELAETAALQYSAEHQEDSFGKARFSAALLPMSSYAKPYDSFNSTAPLKDLGNLYTHLVIYICMREGILG